MKKIYKYTIPIDQDTPVFIPSGSRFLQLICQNDTPVVYFAVNPEEKKMEKYFFKYMGTGQEIQEREWEELTNGCYLGTIQMYDGSLILHVWMNGPNTQASRGQIESAAAG